MVFAVITWTAFASPFAFFIQWDRSLSDFYFKLRTVVTPEIQQEGIVLKTQNENISPDILILGVDNRSIETLGRWPFSRSLHADVLNSFPRIIDQSQRERAVFFDFFFLDRENVPENDLAFASAIKENKRVFLETIYEQVAQEKEFSELQFQRLDILIARSGKLTSVSGPWENLTAFMTIQAPLIPFGEFSRSHGFATFTQDHDEIFRRQNLVSKVATIIQEVEISDLQPDLSDYSSHFQRYVYTDKAGNQVTIQSPLTRTVIDTLSRNLVQNGLSRQIQIDNSTELKTTFMIQKIQDIFLPSITLSLALEYWNKSLADIEVVLGSHVLIRKPEIFNIESGKWIGAPYTEVRIPIDFQGAMTINFMGPRSSENGAEYQTFPVRSYSSYATRAPSAIRESWPESRQLSGKVVMIGPFSSGVADDEKNTPLGQMYGVEIHANALNTILMQKFLKTVPTYLSILILFVSIILVAFLASRYSTLLSLIVMFLLVLSSFFLVIFFFFFYSIVYPFSSLLAGIFITFLLVVVYRALTEEREKQRTRAIFSKYVSPDVVTELLLNPPELGGVDKELTVLFSDIRGFTSLSEGMTPQELVNHLNLYLTAMTDIIHEFSGTLDKYVGDEIMCFWGAPLEQKDHAKLASMCALKMIEKLEAMNREWPDNRKIRIGIGLNSGVMTVGNMGSQGRMNYTLMGDNVNLGARLEGTNKEYLTSIIISESTYSHIRNSAIVRELDNIKVKGKNRSVLIYELLDLEKEEENPRITSK